MTDEPPCSDDFLRELLSSVRTIALVGASADAGRPSFRVMRYLQTAGYRVIPVNPTLAGGEILSEAVFPDLSSIVEPVDMVDIFRRSEFAGAVSDAAVVIGAKAVWMQLGVRDDDAAERARRAGLKIVMNRCPKIEIERLTRQTI
ncbi:MAG: hypothetical protein C3F11_15110 [Methylocystaceae bacterium]|nr:MAG: hypothetical protein C3F11_15110 [Methylocystaceae bacterium]